MKYRFIDKYRAQYPVLAMCDVLQINRSSYYAWKRRPETPRERADRVLLVHIRAAHKKSKCRYGSPRIHKALGKKGIRCGRKRVERLMRQNDIRAKGRRRFKATTDSKHSHPVAPNLLNRQFSVEAPNTVWAGDISFIPTKEGWLYLAVVLDLFSRRVVGWSLQTTLAQSLVLDALEMAIARRQPGSDLLHHSDRGSQYAAQAYQQLLEKHDMRVSMSRKGNCWDNAPVESFFKTLKAELSEGGVFENRVQASTAISEYIEVFYNYERMHSTLDYMSPVAYETMRRVA